MTDLIQRLQDASEGSRELDAMIADAIKWWPNGYTRIDFLGRDRRWNDKKKNESPDHVDCPSFTTSIDAAMTLVPEGFILRRYDASRFVPHTCEVSVSYAHGGFIGHSDHSFALALCIAALRAKDEGHE